mmetsp:Transcript_38578/g.119917  ORF Transcript_38578/g.119917 Transcript_38578/m.119917 type:complete len:219 (+) Transcript_38578:361-1017(+)
MVRCALRKAVDRHVCDCVTSDAPGCVAQSPVGEADGQLRDAAPHGRQRGDGPELDATPLSPAGALHHPGLGHVGLYGRSSCGATTTRPSRSSARWRTEFHDLHERPHQSRRCVARDEAGGREAGDLLPWPMLEAEPLWLEGGWVKEVRSERPSCGCSARTVAVQVEQLRPDGLVHLQHPPPPGDVDPGARKDHGRVVQPPRQGPHNPRGLRGAGLVRE